jgi:hypothetical protein
MVRRLLKKASSRCLAMASPQEDSPSDLEGIGRDTILRSLDYWLRVVSHPGKQRTLAGISHQYDRLRAWGRWISRSSYLVALV